MTSINHIEVALRRHGSIPGVGTFGSLHVLGDVYPTVEREWLDNKGFMSCIPTGRYELVPYSSAKYPDVYALYNPALGVYVHQEDIPVGVHGRWAILIHIANLPSEVVGCIGPGMRRDIVTNAKGETGFGVANSGAALRKIKAVLDAYEKRYVNITDTLLNW